MNKKQENCYIAMSFIYTLHIGIMIGVIISAIMLHNHYC